MRLNDFTNKRSSRKTAATRQPIVVQNDAKVQQLQKHIDDLEQQLSTNIGLEDERDSAIRRKNSVEEGHSALSTENEQLTQQVQLIQNSIIDYEKRISRIAPLEEELRSQVSRSDLLQNDLLEQIKLTQKLQTDLNNMESQTIGLLDENKAIQISETKATADFVSISEEYTSIKNTFDKIKTFATEESKIKQELEKEVYELRDNRNFWQLEAEEAKIQVQQTAIIEDRLRNWITALENDQSDSQKQSSAATSIVKELKETVTEMGDIITSLMKERNFLQQENAKYREEASRPKYLSMGSIMAKEGISMPLGKENLRTKYLGNGRPTLLKFRNSGESNDA
tara:strand:- start:4259 stop:5275 length:1017 start_codon:yes stop_codon:yes gene_type:complete